MADVKNTTVDEIRYPEGHAQGAPQAPAYVQPADGTVSQTALSRVEAQNAALAKVGIKWERDTVYALGTRALQDVCMGRVREERMAVEQMPTALEALESLRDRCVAMDRRSRDLELAGIGSDALTGQIVLTNGSKAVIGATDDAWSHVASFYGVPGLTGFLPVAPAHLRAAVCRHYSEAEGKALAARFTEYNAAKDRGEKAGRKPEPRTVRVAHRLNLKTGQREAYRVASPNYHPFEAQDAAKAILESSEARAALSGAHARVRYDGRRATLDFIWTTDEELYRGAQDYATGDVFRAAQRLTLDEVRGGSTAHQSFAWRNGCMNMGIIISGKSERTAWRHTTETEGAEGLISQVLSMVKSHRADMSGFLDTWISARRNRILDAYNGDPKPVFTALVSEGMVDLPGLRSVSAKVEALMDSWNKEPGSTVADISNAVTRAAHEGDWWSNTEAAEETELEGGKLIYVKNLVSRVATGWEAWQAAQEAEA